MVSEELQIGDPVWAKMKGYPPWPAKIIDPPSNIKSPKHKKARFVLFFGTGDHAWILNENITPHSESMLAEAKNRKKNTVTYQNSIDALLSYSKSIEKDNVENVKHIAKSDVLEDLNDESKKIDKNILTSKALLKKVHKKRSSYDFNGESADYSSKSAKLGKIHRSHFSSITHIPVSDSNFEQNKLFNDEKVIRPSNLMFGFIGLGLLGKQIVKNLLQSGHKISIWNKTSSQCDTFLEMGAKKARYPADLIVNCDVTFCCVSDPEASKAIIFGENGVLNGLDIAYSLGMRNKGYVEMTNIDPPTSQKNCEAVLMKRGTYLEAPVCGTSKDAEEGNLLIVGAGDRKLFEKCETCFYSIGKVAYYMNCDVGVGSLICLIYSALNSGVCTALAESVVLMERLKYQKSYFSEFLKHGDLECRDIVDKCQKMDDLTFEKETSLALAQKDISLVLSIANHFTTPVFVFAAVNEIYKRGRHRNYSNEDKTAVYKVIKY